MGKVADKKEVVLSVWISAVSHVEQVTGGEFQLRYGYYRHQLGARWPEDAVDTNSDSLLNNPASCNFGLVRRARSLGTPYRWWHW